MNTLYFETATDEALETCAALIRAGETVAFPTETVYGLGADAASAEAVGKIYSAKGREGDNPLIVHFADPEDIAAYAEIPDKELFNTLASRFMPGPLTVVLPRKAGGLTPRVSAGLSTVAVRVPSHPVARELIKKAGVPIAAPSANRSHRPSPTEASHVLEDLDGRIAAVLNGGSCAHGVESTVLLLGEELRLLRPGAVTVEMLEAATGRHVTVDRGVLSPVAAEKKVASPGMKYRHYAPKAPIVAVTGDEERVRAFFVKEAESGAGILCYEEDLAFLPQSERVISLGCREDAASQAQRLFFALRTFDKLGVERIFSRLPAEAGIGLAVKNRLLRACEFQQKEV